MSQVIHTKKIKQGPTKNMQFCYHILYLSHLSISDEVSLEIKNEN